MERYRLFRYSGERCERIRVYDCVKGEILIDDALSSVPSVEETDLPVEPKRECFDPNCQARHVSEGDDENVGRRTRAIPVWDDRLGKTVFY